VAVALGQFSFLVAVLFRILLVVLDESVHDGRDAACRRGRSDSTARCDALPDP
jgi:hypothetical protein